MFVFVLTDFCRLMYEGKKFSSESSLFGIRGKQKNIMWSSTLVTVNNAKKVDLRYRGVLTQQWVEELQALCNFLAQIGVYESGTLGEQHFPGLL